MYRKKTTLGSLVVLAFITIGIESIAQAAQPFVFKPPELSDCELPAVKIPAGVSSNFWFSDVCGTIFISPPTVYKAEEAWLDKAISEEACGPIRDLVQQRIEIQERNTLLVKNILAGQISEAQKAKEKKTLAEASELVASSLRNDFITYGATVNQLLHTEWEVAVQAYKDLNEEYQVLALPLVAGVVTFAQRLLDPNLELDGFTNALEQPYIDFTISGLTDNALQVDDSQIPIYFPDIKSDRAGYESVIVTGKGGALTKVRLNKVGFCSYIGGDAQPLGQLAPVITYFLTLKTSGSYSVSVNSEYLLKVMKELVTSSSGTAYASAIADDFYRARGSNTVEVLLDETLTNSLSNNEVLKESLEISALLDLANQFLTTVTGVGSERKDVQLPEVQDVEKYKTVQKINRVCKSKSRWGGLKRSRRCYDQAYNVKILVDTEQFQRAESLVKGSFTGDRVVGFREFLYIPQVTGAAVD